MTPRGSNIVPLIQGLTCKQLKYSLILAKYNNDPSFHHIYSSYYSVPLNPKHTEIESLPVKRHSEARKSKQNILDVGNFNHNPYSTLNRINDLFMEK